MARNKRISIDFSSSGLNDIVKELGKVKKTAGEVKLDSSATKHLNDVTEKVEELEEKLAKIERSKLDASQFKRFSDEIKQGFATIEESFRNLNVALKELGDNPAFQKIGAEVDKIAQKNAEAMKSVQSTIKETSKIINESAKASEIKSKSKTTPKTVEGLKSANESSAKQVSDIEKVTKAEQKKTDELNKQAKALEKINDEKTKSKSKSKSTQDVEAPKEKVLVDLGVVKGADVKLKDTISKIVNGINETNPTVEVRVAFVSNYKTRARQEIIQQLNENLDKAYEFTPKSKKAQDKFYGIIEDARAQFMKELNKDSMRLDFETNIEALKTEIPDALNNIKKALGEIELDANVKINKEQIQEQLGELQNFTLTINNIEFSKNFLDNINGAYKLIEEKEKVQKSVGDEDIVDDDQLKQLEDLISKATKVNDLIKHMSKTIGTIPLSAEFDKTQIQESLDQLYGLTLKISELDVENIKGVVNGSNFVVGAGGPAVAAPSVVYNVISDADNASSKDSVDADKKVASATQELTEEEKKATEELQKAQQELHKMVKYGDSLAKSLVFNKDGSISRSAEGKRGADAFLTSFIDKKGNRVTGKTLLDWMTHTGLLGEGDIKEKNARYLEDRLSQIGARNKVPSPQSLLSNLKLTKSGHIAKKGNDKAIEELLYSLLFYGVNKDADTSLSNLLPKDINRNTLNDIDSALQSKHPIYGRLRKDVLIPSTPSAPQNTQAILDESLSSLNAVSDKFEDINKDIAQYAKLSKISVDELDKTFSERLDMAASTGDYKSIINLSKSFSESKDIQETRNQLWGSVISSLTTMSPQEYSSMMSAIEQGKYGNIGKFIKTYQEKDPKGWERLLQSRNVKIDEEVGRQLKGLESVNGEFLSNDKNLEKFTKLFDYLSDTFDKINPAFFKEMQSKYKLSDAQMKTIRSEYKSYQDSNTAALHVQKLRQEHGTSSEISQEDIDAYIETNKLSKSVAKKMREFWSVLEETIAETQKTLQEQEQQEEKNVRIKTKAERVESHQKKQPDVIPSVPNNISPVEVSRREGYDTWFGDVQGLIQRANTSVDTHLFSGDSLNDVQQRFNAYIQKLSEIKDVVKQINYYKEAIKGQTGEELSDEDVFKEIFPASETSAKVALTNLNKYEEYYKEAIGLAEKILQANKVVSASKPETPLPSFSFSDEQVDAINSFADKVSFTDKGSLKQTKANAAQLEKMVDAIHDMVRTEESGEAFDVSKLQGKLDIPEMQKFADSLKEQRRAERELTEDFEKLTYQMSKLDEGSSEYQELSSKRQQISDKISESTKQRESLLVERQRYEDNLLQSIDSAYKKKYFQVGQDGSEGYVEGFKQNAEEVPQTAEDMVKAGLEATAKAQDSHSPSKKYKQLGIWAVEGYLDAIDEMIPLVKDAASKIKLSPDGTLDNSEQNLKIYDYFVKGLKKLGATEVGLRNPNNDLSIFYEQMQRTNSGRISLSKSNSLNVEGFLNKYMQGYSADKDTFEAVMKSLEVNEEDSKILWQQLGKLLTRRHTEFTNRLKSLVSNLSTNKDGTFSKKNGVNDSKYNDLYNAYTSMRASTINKGGEALNKTTFNKFASDMGLSEENTKRMWDAFVDIFEQRKKQNELLKKQALQAIEDEKKAKQKANEDNLEQELKNIDEVSDKQEKANKEYEKQRRKLLEELKRISEDERRFPLESFREEAKNAYDKINNGEDLSIGENVRQRARDYGKVEDYWKLVGRANALINSNTNSKQAIAGARELLSALKEIDPASYMSANALGKISDSLGELEATSKAAGKTFMSSIVDRLRKANADFFARYLSIRDIIRYFREFMQTVTEFDTALTEMRKVSDESVASLKEYQKVTFDVADALGTTAVQVQQSTADWLRLGETMEQAAESAKVATTLFNVSEFENINDATTALVAMSQAYQDLDKTEIVDVMNNIGNNYSIATDKLALALQASASALMTQGNDLYEATALITAANAVVQDYSKAGMGMRTIALRIGGQRLDKDELKKELDELGEEVDEWVVQTESKKRQVIMEYTRVAANDYQGVDILDANGNLKDTYHIMLEISKVYKQIQEEDKKFGTNRAQGLVEELAGKTRANVAASILMNPKLLEDVYNSALNSQGSAAEENAKYLDSVVGKTQQLKNEWQKFQTQLLDSDLLKDLLDIGKILLSFVNQLIAKIPHLTTLIAALGLSILAMSKDVFSAVDGASKFQLIISGLTAYIKSFTKAQTTAVVATNAETAALEAQTKAQTALAIASKAKNAIITIILTLAISLIAKLIKHIITYRKEIERAANESRDAIKEINNNLKETTETVDDVAQKYAEMAQKVSNLGSVNQSQGSLTTDEYKEFLEISDQLNTIFPELTQAYDENGHAILSLSGDVESIVAQLKELVAVKRELASEDILENAGNVFKDDAKKYAEAERKRKKSEDEWKRQQKIYEAILTGKGIEDLDTNDVQQVFDRAFGSFNYLDSSNPMDRVTYDYMKHNEGAMKGGFDFSKLTDEEIETIKNQYAKVRSTYLKEQNEFERDVKKANADFRTYMNEYVSTVVDDDVDKQLIGAVLDNFDYGQLTDEERKNFDKAAQRIEDDYISAIQSMDDEELKQTMVDVLNDASINAVEKVDFLKQIIDSLPKQGYTPDDPFYVYWQSQYEGEKTKLDNAINHILPSMKAQSNDTKETMSARATEWIRQLNPEQLEAVLNTPIKPNTINSYEDLLDLIKQINNETSKYESIGQLLSQDNYVDDSVKKARERYNEEWKEANSKGTQFNQTTYGNVDLNNRGVLEWDETNIEKYTKAIESWGASVEDYAGSISTVDAMWEKFDGVDIAFTPILQTPNGPEYLDSETVYKYINTLMSQLPEGWNDEDLFKLDAQGIEVNGKKIKGLIAGIGDEAKRVSETMHYLGKDGSLALSEKELQTAKEAAITWGDVRADLVGMAQSGKLDENTLRQYKYFNEIIKALGLSANVTDDELKTMIDEINKIAKGDSVDKLSDAKTNLDKLDSAYKKFQNKEFVDSSSLNEVQDTFAYLGEAYRDFEDAVKRGENDLQPYFDNIATQYAIQEGLLEDLTEASEEWTVQQLVNAGITENSAREGVALALKQKQMLEGTLLGQIRQINTVAALDEETKQYIATATDLNSIDAKTISDLIREAMATGELSGELQTAAQNVALYAAQKALAQGADLRNSDDFDYLIELIKATGVATEAVERLEQAKARSAQNTAALDKAQADYNNFATKMSGKYGANWQNKLDYGERNSLNAYSYNLNNAISNVNINDSNIESLIGEVSDAVEDAWKKQDPNLGIKFNYGGAVESAEAGGKEAAEAFKDALDKILAMYDAELDAGVITFQTYVDKSRQAIEQYYNEGKIKASEYYDYLANLYQKQVSEYDKVISAVQRLLKKQTDELQKQKEAIEESYNLQIEEIQKKIDALRDENDEIDKNMALQKAQ